MNRFRLSLAVLAGAALVACQSGGNSTAGTSGGSSGGSSGTSGDGAAVTSVGAVIPGLDIAHASIDASGGTLTSSDGQLTITVPPGALSSSTQLSITAIVNEAPNGVGFGYRLEPNGTTFAQPVTLTFKPTFGQFDGATASYDNVALAYQDDQGRWAEVKTLTPNAADGSVSATTAHFTDYAYLLSLELVAEEDALLGGQATGVSVSSVKAIPIGDGLYVSRPVPMSLTGNPTWMLNGTSGVAGADGELDPINDTASYTAPTQKPPHNPETVSVSFSASGGQQVTLLTNIYVLAHKYDLAVNITTNAVCSPQVQFAFSSTESNHIEVDLDASLDASAGPAQAGVPPNVTGVASCVSGVTASFEESKEPVGMQLNAVSGGWNAALHRLEVVARGDVKLLPVLAVTGPTGTTSYINDDTPSAWNTRGQPFYLDGTADLDEFEIPTSSGAYTGNIGAFLTPTQF